MVMVMRFPWNRDKAVATPDSSSEVSVPRTNSSASIWKFLRWLGPALMVSIAYMDPGNYGTDIGAGAGYGYDLLWAVWLASAMAMMLQYLSGKLGIASGYSLPELVRESLGGKKRYIIPYWLAAEAAAIATDLAEYLGTVLALNILFGIPLLYASIFAALDVVILLLMMTRRFSLVEQYFMLLTSILVIGLLYNLFAVGPESSQVVYGSVVPLLPDSGAILLVSGIIGATVMPHALFVHSWLTRNKMDMMNEKEAGKGAKTSSVLESAESEEEHTRYHYSLKKKEAAIKLHRDETILVLAVAGVINAAILIIAVPLFQGYGVNENLSVEDFVAGLSAIYGPAIGVLFALTLLASGLASSTLGTIAGQIIMEGLIGIRGSVWVRRIVTRVINVFPTTIAILLGLSPLALLVYSQAILSLLIPLPMIPLVYYTSKKKVMGTLVNRRTTIILALLIVILIFAFNLYLIITSYGR